MPGWRVGTVCARAVSPPLRPDEADVTILFPLGFGDAAGAPPGPIAVSGSEMLGYEGCRRTAADTESPSTPLAAPRSNRKGSPMALEAEVKKAIIEEYATTPGDTRFPEVQAALLTQSTK